MAIQYDDGTFGPVTELDELLKDIPVNADRIILGKTAEDVSDKIKAEQFKKGIEERLAALENPPEPSPLQPTTEELRKVLADLRREGR